MLKVILVGILLLAVGALLAELVSRFDLRRGRRHLWPKDFRRPNLRDCRRWI